jgi:arginine exporter protein ArgO
VTDTVLSGLWAGYGLAVPVGAVAVLMIHMTVREGFRAGAAAAMGATGADSLYAVAAVLGGSAVATAVQPFSGPLRWTAAVILALMAARVLVTALRRSGAAVGAGAGAGQQPSLSSRRAFFTYFGLTALNPWPAIYFVALILGRQAQGPMSAAESVVYTVSIVVASGSWQLFLAFGASVLGRFITSARGRMITAVVSSALIFALAGYMVLGG